MTQDPSFGATKPFIAWSCSHDYNALSSTFQISCEKHLREFQDQICDLIGPSAIEGIIIYDHLQRGMAVASLLTKEGKTLPESGHGHSCDSHFDEEALCWETNMFNVTARLHDGARGMLVRTGEKGERQFMLLDQREAAHLHPIGSRKTPDLHLAAYGLLAHENAHARDYADGRPGLPSLDAVTAAVGEGHGDAVHAIADMALAEYVATRAECRAQVEKHGACAEDLTRRIGQMARQNVPLPDLDQSEPEGTDAFDQRQMDLSTAGYFIGTLAAYREAQAPVRGEDGHLLPDRTDQMLARQAPRNSALAGLIERSAPALERAARAPDAASRTQLATTLESAIIDAQEARRERSRPKARDTSLDDWFDGI